MKFHICSTGEYMASTKVPIIQNPDSKTFYLVPDGTGEDLFTEWVHLGNGWEIFGSAKIDITPYVRNTDFATTSSAGIVKVNPSYGMGMCDIPNQNTLMVYKANSQAIKEGTQNHQPIVPATEHEAVFYGLAKAAGDSTQASGSNAVGTYTSGAKSAIQNMLGVVGKNDLPYVTPEMFGAIGDGVTDDSEAVQSAVNAGYAVYFGSNKTYYLPSTITINHDCHLFGGENTTIKTETVNGSLNTVFEIDGTLKKTTTLTTDYTAKGSTANSGNKFTLTDMADIAIGDVMVITATDQYYNYSRSYYYLGATLLIGDMYDGHLYTTNAMAWDIENTQNVSVKIYSAPVAIIENLHFVADMNAHGHYKYLIKLRECKNSIIRNCDFTRFDSGICLEQCVNTLVEAIQMSKSEEAEISGDGYSLLLLSCTNTVVDRMMPICSQAGISLSGTIPNINTYIHHCELASECRRHGVAMHENSYNSVIEDCTLGGLNALGTAIVNRCRFINNQRTLSDGGITFCGSHNPDYAILKVKDCVFESTNGVYLYNSTPQDPIQAYNNIIGLVEISGCKGGMLTYQSNSSQYTLSNVIKNLWITRWTNCYEVYRPNTSDIIEKFYVTDCTFDSKFWLNDHVEAHGVTLTNVYDINYHSSIPAQHKVSVNKPVYAEKYTLPENVTIDFASSNSSAQYIVCGKNLMPNDPNDLVVGSVSGSEGEVLTRTKATGTTPALSQDSSGNIVYTQPNTPSSFSMYPVGMFYVKEPCIVRMSAVAKNTGSTTGATFRPYIAVVNCSTGLLIKRTAGTAVQATAQGADLTYSLEVKANCVVLCYVYCNSAVANAVTTFEHFIAYTAEHYAPTMYDDVGKYEAKRRIGDGSIKSLAGVNNIMSSETTFTLSFQADYMSNPIGLLPSGSGVSF